MKCYLTKMATEGRYCLSSHLPIISKVGDTEKIDAYPQAGDHFWVPLLCDVVAFMAGKEAMQLKPMESIRVNITIIPV